MEHKQNNFDSLLKTVLSEAAAAGLPVSDKIDMKVSVNSRAKKRFGMCILKNGRYTIELSSRLLDAPELSCRQTIAHELIHTCPGCDNHGTLFKKYAAVMNRKYGYNIRRTNSNEEMGLENTSNNAYYKYILECQKCGARIKRMKYSSVVADPSRYTCICGGKLKRIL